MSRPQEVSTDSAEILHDTVNRREPLELSGRLETPHLALPLTRRLVGDLASIVRVLISDVDHGRHHDAGRGRVGAQLVGDQPSRDTALGFQQRPKESDGCSPIPGAIARGCPGRHRPRRTARHRYCRRPWIVTNTSSRCQVSPIRPLRRRSRRA